jgi:hypothetical protein
VRAGVVVGAWVRACASACVAFSIQQAKRMRHIVCDLSDSAIFFEIFSSNARFSEKRYETKKLCFDFLYNFYLKQFSF